MPGTTSRLGLVYPLGTDDVKEGAARIEAICEALDTIVVRKAIAAIGDGTHTSFSVNHGLGSTAVVVSVRDAATGSEVDVETQHTDSNHVTLVFASAPAISAYSVTVVG